MANGKPAVLIQISRQPNANIIDTVERIKALLPQFQASLPPTVSFKVDNDRTITIRASVRDAAAQHDDLDRPGDPGGVRLPAQRLGDVHSRASRCRSR